jgi:uncharacterized protein (DUF924 family)
MHAAMTIASPEDVLAFWFGPPAADDAEVMAKVRRWFLGGPEMDHQVIERFAATVEAAVAGALDDWSATPRGRLALVIVLDQLTRNAYRGDPKTYAGDAHAEELALEAFDQGLEGELDYPERLFLAMPLLHSEQRAHQRRALEIAAELVPAAPPAYRQMAAMHHEQSAKYASIIERFGRFPHRNQILGRTSTAEEEQFLVDWAAKGPPRGARS